MNRDARYYLRRIIAALLVCLALTLLHKVLRS